MMFGASLRDCGSGAWCVSTTRQPRLSGPALFCGPVCALWSAAAMAIPPNTPITNTATATYQVAGAAQSISASHTVVTDPASGNSPPTGITLAPNHVAENSPGATIGALAVVDPDPADTHTYSIADPRFQIVGGQLALAARIHTRFRNRTERDARRDGHRSIGCVGHRQRHRRRRQSQRSADGGCAGEDDVRCELVRRNGGSAHGRRSRRRRHAYVHGRRSALRSRERRVEDSRRRRAFRSAGPLRWW